MKQSFLLLSALFVAFSFSKTSFAHCEVPCGIYHDELRVEMIKEHIQTIEKAMNQIRELQQADTINYNQLVRWINTKEHHANMIQEIAEQYFLTQRVKFADPSEKEKYDKYLAQLTTLHQLIVYSMKSKQSTDLVQVKNMQNALEAFEEAYFGEHRHNEDGTHKE
ncbi:MAG: superoxide dismutase [Bacteroidetes bacterium]|nr:MAG: superoxide dismutase [Bacteroidota bacterium]RLD74310.1 MAG: superoxide dismutase [Bacteroidota bacterium]RLD87612.1 MAG: superoxide dismutase [Bacteroidota bacterium]